MKIYKNSEAVSKKKHLNLLFNLQILIMKLNTIIQLKIKEKMVMKLAQLKVKIKLFSKKINKTKMMIFIKIIFLHKNKIQIL